MSLSVDTRMKFSAPFVDFNPRENWEAYQNRHKDPWGYLDSWGIEKVCEMLLFGLHPKQIAYKFGISQNVILKWIDADPYRSEQYDWAFEQAATNEMYDARDIVDDCGLTSEEINKAGKQAEHRRHMSKGLGAKRWGSKVDINATTTATVNYNFNVALLPHQKAALEGESQRITNEQAPALLDLNQMLGASMSANDLCINVKDGLSYEEAQAQETSEKEIFETEEYGEGQEEDGRDE